MKYCDFLKCESLDKGQVLGIAMGNLIADPPNDFGVLPSPPMLMIDRVLEVTRNGTRGRIVAEQDVALDAWYFLCHFRNDPVQPGCLGVDAVWQLVGLYLSLCGAKGVGRALAAGQVDFFGQIRPHNRVVRYEVDIERLSRNHETGTGAAIAKARVLVDGDAVYTIEKAKVATFLNLQYGDYPKQGVHSMGGAMR